MRRNMELMSCFVSLMLSIYTVKLVTNSERNKENLAVETCRLFGGNSTEMLISPFKLNISGCLNMSRR